MNYDKITYYAILAFMFVVMPLCWIGFYFGPQS